jgi:hypothetical protein
VSILKKKKEKKKMEFLKTLGEEDILIPDSPRPPTIVDFKPTPLEGVPLSEDPIENPKPKRKPRNRQSIKERPKKPRASGTRKRKQPEPQTIPITDQKQENQSGPNGQSPTVSVSPNTPTEPEMMIKVASVLRDGVGFIADKLFKANGSIQHEFQQDQLLAELIHRDMRKYSSFMSNKAQIAVCAGVDVASGYQKRKPTPLASGQEKAEKLFAPLFPPQPTAPTAIRQNENLNAGASGASGEIKKET